MGRLRLLVGLVISGVALYVAFSGVDWGAVSDAFRRADYRLVVAAVPVLLIFTVIRALRWRVLFQPETRVPLLSAFGALNIGYMASNVFPFQLGDLVRVYVLGEKENLSKSRVLSTVVVERVLDILVLLSILAILLPFIDLPRAAIVTSLCFFAGALVLGVVMLLAALDRDRAERGLRLLLAVLPKRVQSPVAPTLTSLLDGISALRHAGLLLQAVGWTAVSWLTSSFAIYLLLQAFSLDVPLIAAPFLLIATTFGFFVPSSPGGVGVYHAITVRSLTTVFSVPIEAASSYALAAHALYLLPPTLVGAGFLWWYQLGLGRLGGWARAPKLPVSETPSAPGAGEGAGSYTALPDR